MMQTGVRNTEIYGTRYEICSNLREPGVVVEILGTNYEIFNDSGKYCFYRIDPDGLVVFGIEGLDSERAAIELAEISERMIAFMLNTGHSVDLIMDCVKFLDGHPPVALLDK